MSTASTSSTTSAHVHGNESVADDQQTSPRVDSPSETIQKHVEENDDNNESMPETITALQSRLSRIEKDADACAAEFVQAVDTLNKLLQSVSEKYIVNVQIDLIQ